MITLFSHFVKIGSAAQYQPKPPLRTTPRIISDAGS
jgi:hypothetical protein